MTSAIIQIFNQQTEKGKTAFINKWDAAKSFYEHLTHYYSLSGIAKIIGENVGKEITIAIARGNYKISCTKGCSFCCYIHTDITEGEAELLIPYFDGSKRELLKKQATKTKETWGELPYQERKCVMLKDGQCTAYAVRPSACRKYLVVSPPSKCDTEKEITIATVVAVTDAEILHGMLHSRQKTGSLPKMINSLLK